MDAWKIKLIRIKKGVRRKAAVCKHDEVKVLARIKIELFYLFVFILQICTNLTRMYRI